MQILIDVLFVVWQRWVLLGELAVAKALWRAGNATWFFDITRASHAGGECAMRIRCCVTEGPCPELVDGWELRVDGGDGA